MYFIINAIRPPYSPIQVTMKEILKMTPGRIRAIRKHLGLTQMEAGKLLGGGPHAFSRYESGGLKPNAALTNLLLVLEEYPDALRVLGKDGIHPASPREASPFEVKAEYIASFGPVALTELLRRLLFAEASANGIPLGGIHVASQINAPDGGEDGRIFWEGGLERTKFLPSRRCLFQLKACKITPGKAAGEVITSKKKVKPKVQSLLQQGGHYILLCTHAYNQSLIDKRRERICSALNEAGIPASIDHILFWGADQIAMWANIYPSVTLWIKEKVGIGTFDGINTWGNWQGRSEPTIPLVEDPRLKKLCSKLQETVTRPGGVLRVVGLSGVGKSRLCLEALRRIEGEEGSKYRIRDFTMYTNLSETDGNVIHRIVEKLAASHSRAIIVADNCDAKEHTILAGMISRSGSRLSLLTIDDEIPRHLDSNTIKVDKAPEKVTKHIVRQVAGSMQELDQLRLEKFTRGFPAIAIRISKEYLTRQDFTYPLHDDLIQEFVCGRKPENSELLFKSAKLLAAFGLVRIESPLDERFGPKTEPTKDHLNTIARFGLQLTEQDLHAGIQRLLKRGIVKQRGGLATVEPQPIAVRLAEIQWEEWQKTEWDRILTGDVGSDLNISAAKRLAQLNHSEIALKAVSHVCRKNGPFDLPKIINHPIHAEVLSFLAEVSPNVVAKQIKRCLASLDSQDLIGENVRISLVKASSKIAFHSKTFKIGARLLLQIETIKQSSLMVDVSNPFKKLFTPRLGGTEADGKTRLQFIDEVVDESNEMGDNSQLKLIVDALIEGCTTGRYYRDVGPEIQGLQKILNPWVPTLYEDYYQYIVGCIDRLGKLALRNDDVGEKARSDFGLTISALICNRFIDAVEQVINQVVKKEYPWTMALRQLKVVAVYDSSDIDEETRCRVQLLMKKLEPTRLRGKAKILVTDAPMPEKEDKEMQFSEQIELRCAKVQLLAEEFLENFSTLKQILPELSRGNQTMAGEFGESLAKKASQPMRLTEPIVQAVTNTPKDDRNYELLAGFISGLQMKYPDEAEKFKLRASQSHDLAPAIPMICRKTGLSSTDIDLIIDALERGTLSPWDLNNLASAWVLGNVSSATVAKLLDTLIDHNAPSFALSVIILGRIFSGENRDNGIHRKHIHKLSGFRPQLLRLVKNAGRTVEMKSVSSLQLEEFEMMLSNMEYYFEELVLHMLSKGRDNSDARRVALALAHTLADEDHDDWFNHWIAEPNSVLTKMLSDFPEIVWPLIGGRILTNPQPDFRMTYVMGLSYNSRRNQNPAILDLPRDTLLAWCHANPKIAPVFVAECLPVLNLTGNHSDGFRLHPATSQLINEFGELESVRRALEKNIDRYSGISSTAEYYSRFKEPLELLRNHQKPKVRLWADKMCEKIKQLIKHERIHEAERELWDGWMGWS